MGIRMEQECRSGRLETLEQQAQRLASESKDSLFTEYLQDFIKRLHAQQYQIGLLEQELAKSYQMYLARSRLAEGRENGQKPREEQSSRQVGAAAFVAVGAAFILIAVGLFGMMSYFSGLGAVLISGLIAGGVVAFSWKRDSGLLRMTGLLALYLSMLLVKQGDSPTVFLAVAAVTFLVNLACVVLPLRRGCLRFDTAQILINGFFALAFIGKAALCGVAAYYWPAFVLPAAIVLNLLFIRLLKWGEEKGEDRFDTFGVTAAYCSSSAFCSLLMIMLGGTASYVPWVVFGSLIIYCILSFVSFLDAGKRKERWIFYYFANITVFLTVLFGEGTTGTVLCVLGLLVVSKALTTVKELSVSEAIITAVAALTLLVCHDRSYAVLLLVGLVISALCIHRWQTYYEILLTFTLAWFVALNVPGILSLPAVTGVFLTAIVLFSSFQRYQGRRMALFRYSALAGAGVCFLLLAQRRYAGVGMIYFMMLIFGVSMLLFAFQERYHKAFAYKDLLLSVFLTYMILIGRFGKPVVSSILLMVLALACVGRGFYTGGKKVRIYGLILSLLACGKLVFLDFIGAGPFLRILMFLIAGVVALIIAGIYIVLEKKSR